MDIASNWTLDCWVQVSAGGLRSMGDVGVLAASEDKREHVSVHQDQPADLGGESADGDWASSSVDLLSLQDWVRLSVSVRRIMGHETHSYFIAGQPAGSLQLGASTCDDALCPVNIFAVGSQADGTVPFPLPLHRLRIFEGALDPTQLDASGVQAGYLLRYQPESSRSIKLSRGSDAVEITWDTVGWSAATHEHVHAELDHVGGVSLRCNNVSSLWDRAVASTGTLTGELDVRNWTFSTLPSVASTGLHVRYNNSDPCFDLWDGVTCSLSDWPVGLDDCAERLDCAALSWPEDAHGSVTVCGSSSLVGKFGSGDTCVRESAYDGAASLCTEMGGRLCTAAELEQDEGDPLTCSYDSIFKWSWVDTPAGVCPDASVEQGHLNASDNSFLIRREASCSSASTQIGRDTFPNTLAECAAEACSRTEGCQFFVLGRLGSDSEGICYQEHTIDASCPEGWVDVNPFCHSCRSNYEGFYEYRASVQRDEELVKRYLGKAGRDGAWFSFVPTVHNAFHEIQLYSDGSVDGDSFAVIGVFDEHGEVKSGQSATTHRTEYNAMLRWNATQLRSAAFVHVSSTVTRRATQ